MKTRRDFLKMTAVAAGGVLVAACGGGGGGADMATDCKNNGTSASVSNNHGHTVNVPKADVVAGTAKTYTLTTGNAHTHTVMVGAADFAKLQNNMSVSIGTSTDDAHSHSVIITCV